MPQRAPGIYGKLCSLPNCHRARPCSQGAGNASRCSILGPSILFFQELNANLSNLTSAFEKATAEKIKCQQEADATNRVISLANR